MKLSVLLLINGSVAARADVTLKALGKVVLHVCRATNSVTRPLGARHGGRHIHTVMGNMESRSHSISVSFPQVENISI